MAVMYARGQLDVGQDYVNAGPIGTTFTGRITGTTQVGPYPAIIPTIAGQGWIYGTSNYTLGATDPIRTGVTPTDIWA